jgi:peptidoglycan hydrolase-like protein with peptidoglycan-binding domain
MTPFSARLATVLVLTLAVGVAFNALLLQGAPGPRVIAQSAATKPSQIATAGLPASPTVAAGDLTLWQARLKLLEAEAQGLAAQSANGSAAGETPRAQKPESEDPLAPPSPQTIRAIQRELATRGFDPGPVDGTIGLMTRAAIMAYEHDEGLLLSGEPTEALLRRIILGASAEDAGPLATPKSRESAERLIRGVQQALQSLSYAPGELDGVLGEDTVRAIREFEMDQGLVPTGRVSGRLIVRLARAAGKAFVVPVR